MFFFLLSLQTKEKARTLETLVQTAWQMSESQTGHGQLIAKTFVHLTVSATSERTEESIIHKQRSVRSRRAPLQQ